MRLKEFLEGLEFGAPWRQNERSLSAVIPILSHNFSDRNYVLIQEVEDEVDIKDTGSISRASVRNRTGENVFFRKGTLLKGATQSRGVRVGTVIPPLSTREVEVQCVHASRGIRSGAEFHVARGVAPRAVERAFLRRASQSETWAAVSGATASYFAMAAMPSQTTGYYSDDLVGTLESVQRFRDDVEDALKEVPADLKDQVGIAIVDGKGVVGAELFDHPDSWRAFSKSVIRNYADVITGETSELFEIRRDKVVPAVTSFLEKLEEAEETTVSEVEGSKTYALDGEGVVGECTMINGRVIHLICARKEEEEEKGRVRPMTIPSFRSGSQRPPTIDRTPIWTAYLPPEHWKTRYETYFRGKGAYSLLTSLKEPKTWKDLEGSLGLSTRTLSRRIDEAKGLGLVNHKPRLENGRMAYKLTEKGWEALRKFKDEAAR